jgi:hypothetical protein
MQRNIQCDQIGFILEMQDGVSIQNSNDFWIQDNKVQKLSIISTEPANKSQHVPIIKTLKKEGREGKKKGEREEHKTYTLKTTKHCWKKLQNTKWMDSHSIFYPQWNIYNCYWWQYLTNWSIDLAPSLPIKILAGFLQKLTS